MTADDEPDHYEVLGIGESADVSEVRAAYRELAKTTHPDAGGSSAAFRAVLEAYQVLTNPLQRRQFDDRRRVRRRDFRAPQPAPEPTSWEAGGSRFTGDVEFPAYLRDVADAPWQDPSRPGSGPATASAPRAADVLWWWQQPVVAHPVLAGHLVLAPIDGALVALDVLAGQEVWRAGLPGTAQAGPVLSGDLVLVWTDDGTVHGLEVARGTTRWEHRGGPVGPGGLAVAESVVVTSGPDQGLAGLEVATGRPRWTARAASPVTQPLVADGSVVLLGTALGVECLEARKGRRRWRAPTRLPVDLPLQLAEGAAWVSAGGGALHRLSVANGAVEARWEVTSPVAGLTADGAVLYATVAGPPQVVAVGPDGWTRWATATSMVCPEPALLAGTAYLADPRNRLTAVDTVDGRVVASSSLPFEPFGPPLAAVDRLVVRERGGYLWCAALPEG